MRFIPYFLVVLFFLIGSCDSTTSTNQTSDTKATPATDVKTNTSEGETKVLQPTTSQANKTELLPEKHTCKPQGNILEDNQTWIRNEQLLICIAADSITKDMDFGESHRILDVYDTKDCSLLNRTILPVNNSPDFPYYLSANTYDDQNNIICTQGFEFTFCFDLEQRKMIDRLTPDYLSKREATDAQSGSPMGLKIWKHCLFGYAQDLGAYAFNVKDKKQINAMLPIAEYPIKEQPFAYKSLFLIEVENGKYQAIYPNMGEDDFELKTLFKSPKLLDPQISKSVRDNRYLVFNVPKTSPVKHIAIDMEKVVEVALPNDVSIKKSSEILSWLKGTK